MSQTDEIVIAVGVVLFLSIGYVSRQIQHLLRQIEKLREGLGVEDDEDDAL